MFWEFIKEYNIISALITGAFGFFSILAGVAWATRKSIIIKRAKFETKEKMKIESVKEIIKAIKDFYPVIYSTRYQVCVAIDNLIIKLKKMDTGMNDNQDLDDVGILAFDDFDDKHKVFNLLKMQFDRAEKYSCIREKIIEKQKFVLFIEEDSKINGYDEGIKKEINKIEKIFNEIESIFIVEENENTIEESIPRMKEIRGKYKEYDDQEAKSILNNLIDLYIKRLS